ncbi:unnamed protein product [Sphagnum jensenii]|uniref:Uncharacterized protein n=2 Tax=Sphagnum jensenii TaxID=128206 RepID=A0ABP1BGJ4_9BRYO
MQAVASVASVGDGQELYRPVVVQADQNGVVATTATTAAVAAEAMPSAGELGSVAMTLGGGGVVDSTLQLRALYPPALATHQEVVASKDLFLDTLNKFHTALGAKLLAIPKIGGKALDLHFLYVEVTSRGGCQQVIKDRKWKELQVAFNFPHTTTSAAYVLRKYYIVLLHHYEQVYFLGTQGPLVPPPSRLHPLGAPRCMTKMPDPSVSIGRVVTGAIEGKFEHGYLVSIIMGTEKLRGVLYHLPSGHRGLQHASVHNLPGTLGAELQIPSREIPTVQSSGRKRRKRKKDPKAPRSHRSGYNFFFVEQHMKLKTFYRDRERELSRLIGAAWNRLTDEEKSPYQDQAVKDKERFQKEMQEYQESLKIHDGVIPAGSGLQQELTVGKEKDTIDDIRDQQVDNMVAKLVETFGTSPPEPNLSSPAVSEHEDSSLRNQPRSPYVTPEQETFYGNDNSEVVSDHGVYG